jgi:hypothetical protein
MDNEIRLMSSFQAHIDTEFNGRDMGRGFVTRNFTFTPTRIPKQRAGTPVSYIWTSLCYMPLSPIPYNRHPLQIELCLAGSLITLSHMKYYSFQLLLTTKPAADPALGF